MMKLFYVFGLALAVCGVLSISSRADGQVVELPSPAETIIVAEASPSDSTTAEPALATGDLPSDDYPTTDVFPPKFRWLRGPGWMMSPVWEKGFELGLNGSEGNAESLSLSTAGHLKRDTETSAWGIDIVYAKTEANDVMTQHYAFLNSRYDYKLGESRWSLFHITRIEYDEFKAFDWRLAINGGLGYGFVRSDTVDLTGRFGAGTSREFGGLNDEWVPEAVFGMDYKHEISKRQKLSLTSDYYPAWENFNDYRLVTQASWEILLDEATNLNLKLGFLDRYDSTPMGLKANDVSYFITLLWKL